jgi:hypothetical protein
MKIKILLAFIQVGSRLQSTFRLSMPPLVKFFFGNIQVRHRNKQLCSSCPLYPHPHTPSNSHTLAQPTPHIPQASLPFPRN